MTVETPSLKSKSSLCKLIRQLLLELRRNWSSQQMLQWKEDRRLELLQPLKLQIWVLLFQNGIRKSLQRVNSLVESNRKLESELSLQYLLQREDRIPQKQVPFILIKISRCSRETSIWQMLLNSQRIWILSRWRTLWHLFRKRVHALQQRREFTLPNLQILSLMVSTPLLLHPHSFLMTLIHLVLSPSTAIVKVILIPLWQINPLNQLPFYQKISIISPNLSLE
jgi:hypothetical protein